MTGREWILKPSGLCSQAMHAIRPGCDTSLPSLITGDPRLEPLNGVLNALVERVCAGSVPSRAAIASISRRGLGMLPIGSVGIVIGVSQFGDL